MLSHLCRGLSSTSAAEASAASRWLICALRDVQKPVHSLGIAINATTPIAPREVDRQRRRYPQTYAHSIELI
jgi:hypothetical protein